MGTIRTSSIQLLKGAITFRLYDQTATPYLQSNLLANSGVVDHGFSTRIGGCSTGPAASLNMAFHTGDSVENVLENRRRFFNTFYYDYRQTVSALQVHGTDFAVFDSSSRGEGSFPGSARRECDALVTTEKGLPLAAYAADCMLIYIVSPEKPLLALVHAGWRGTLGKIGPRVINFIKMQYGLRPEKMLAALSPTICRDCYRVDADTANKFASAGWSKQVYLEAQTDGTYKLDLIEINRAQLQSCGIQKDNLDCSLLCTSCNKDLFYSYRRDHGNTGRMIGFAAIKI